VWMVGLLTPQLNNGLVSTSFFDFFNGLALFRAFFFLAIEYLQLGEVAPWGGRCTYMQFPR